MAPEQQGETASRLPKRTVVTLYPLPAIRDGSPDSKRCATLSALEQISGVIAADLELRATQATAIDIAHFLFEFFPDAGQRAINLEQNTDPFHNHLTKPMETEFKPPS